MPFPTAKIVEFNGKAQSLTKWARELDVDIQTLRFRLRRWPLEQALTVRPYARRKIAPDAEMTEAIEKADPAKIKFSKNCFKYIEFQGKRLPQGEWARIVGLNPFTLSTRLIKRGWSIERALTTQPMQQGRKREVNG